MPAIVAGAAKRHQVASALMPQTVVVHVMDVERQPVIAGPAAPAILALEARIDPRLGGPISPMRGPQI